MIDRDNVIKGLELCTNISPDGCLMLCPYKDEKDETYSGFCEQVLKQDALALLKEHEPVKPEYKLFPGSATIHEWECGNCGYSLFMILSHENRYSAKSVVRYCAGCGRPVKWE